MTCAFSLIVVFFAYITNGITIRRKSETAGFAEKAEGKLLLDPVRSKTLLARLLLAFNQPPGGWPHRKGIVHRSGLRSRDSAWKRHCKVFKGHRQCIPRMFFGKWAARGDGEHKFEFSWSQESIKEQETEGFHHDVMIADPGRTPIYEQAIQERLQQAGPGELTVLDIGTGPFAVFAIAAARAGAKRVYAIELDGKAIQQARDTVADAGFEDVIEIIKGVSTEVTLPEKVDVVISEIVGNVASDEGLYVTILDAHERHVKNPTDPRSWIPHRVQTVGAPVTYGLHGGLGHPSYLWLERESFYAEEGYPLYMNCSEDFLCMLAPPAFLEDIRFTDPQTLVGAGVHALTEDPVSFPIEESRLKSIQAYFQEQFSRKEAANASAVDAQIYATIVARGLSGFALWPRLELDPDAKFVVQARGEGGIPQSGSSWRTVFHLIDKLDSLPIAHGSKVTAQMHIELERADPTSSPAYTLDLGVTDSTETEVEAGQKLLAARRAEDRNHDFDLFERLEDTLFKLTGRDLEDGQVWADEFEDAYTEWLTR